MAENVCILGTGQMAVMCATLLCDNGHHVTLLGRSASVAHIRQTRQSSRLPGVELPKACCVSEDVAAADADLLVLAVPAQAVAIAMREVEGIPTCPAVSCSKGIEIATGRRPSEVIAPQGKTDRIGPVAVLSGPNIAAEVVRRKPAGAVVACVDAPTAERVRAAFMTDYFRVYTNTDVVGVELAGALKNVIALAAGIIDGLGLGNNAKASLITRGIVEIRRLGEVMGADAETFNGLAGLGDLITTCISPTGRNRTVGERVGRGEALDGVLASLGSVCEGVPTTQAVRRLAEVHGIDMPILDAVHAVLFEGRNVRDALLDLMTREPKSE